jgi:hypothetical protein
MENTSTVVSGALAATEPIDRRRFRARIMGKSVTSSETRKIMDSNDHIPTVQVPLTPDSTFNRPGLGGATYTLRIKPDRRRAQQPIAPESDRRRHR